MNYELHCELITREGLKSLGITYSNTHFLRLEAKGRFPKRIYLSRARVAWIEREIKAWLAERAVHRAPPPPLDFDHFHRGAPQHG